MSERLTKVEFTNLDKVLYPELRITKAQVIEYCIKIAPKMLNPLADRPIVLTRFPNGIDKEGFYEKDAPLGTPARARATHTTIYIGSLLPLQSTKNIDNAGLLPICIV
jgi:DNA primase